MVTLNILYLEFYMYSRSHVRPKQGKDPKIQERNMERAVEVAWVQYTREKEQCFDGQSPSRINHSLMRCCQTSCSVLAEYVLAP